jgi:hypothetical protein
MGLVIEFLTSIVWDFLASLLIPGRRRKKRGRGTDD